MPQFSQRSLRRLKTCHQDLQDICHELIKYADFTVLCGFRGEAEQDEAYSKGVSKLKWPNSKHNKFPSLAVDIAPYPIDWNNHVAFEQLAKQFCNIALEKGIKVTWGGTFTKLRDLPHFELKG